MRRGKGLTNYACSASGHVQRSKNGERVSGYPAKVSRWLDRTGCASVFRSRVRSADRGGDEAEKHSAPQAQQSPEAL